MIIVLIESDIKWENKNKNIKLFRNDIDEIMAKCNPDLVCLPEMSFTGFSMNVKCTGENERETVNKVMDVSKEYNIKIAFGWVECCVNHYLNHYSITDGENVILDYVKIHPFSYGGESILFEGGNKLPINFIDEFNVGIQICYDLRFPETFQILSKRADLIIVPANWPYTRIDHWDILLKARAIENQTYIVGINCRGEIGENYYPGHSCIVKPDGKICNSNDYLLGSNNRAYIYQIYNNVNDYRNEFPVKSDRKEKLYVNLFNKYL